MIVLVSPAKQMDFNSEYPAGFPPTQALFAAEAIQINTLLRRFNRESMANLMKTSPALSDQVVQMVGEFGAKSSPGKPAFFAYSGTVFKAIEPSSLSSDELVHANSHLRILSGMYGILRPSDMIEPYRLEMKTILDLNGISRNGLPAEHGNKKSLRSFWEDRVSQTLAEEPFIINLASAEYAQVVNKKKLNGRFVNIHFKERSGEGLRSMGMYAKRARGLMVRHLLQEKITNPGRLKNAEIGGYCYRLDLSDDSNWTFVRG